jgi:hypothetical protein
MAAGEMTEETETSPEMTTGWMTGAASAALSPEGTGKRAPPPEGRSMGIAERITREMGARVVERKVTEAVKREREKLGAGEVMRIVVRGI